MRKKLVALVLACHFMPPHAPADALAPLIKRREKATAFGRAGSNEMNSLVCEGDMSTAFQSYIGIGYSGAKTCDACLKGLWL